MRCVWFCIKGLHPTFCPKNTIYFFYLRYIINKGLVWNLAPVLPFPRGLGGLNTTTRLVVLRLLHWCALVDQWTAESCLLQFIHQRQNSTNSFLLWKSYMLQYSVRVYMKQKTHFRQVMAIEGAFNFIYSSGFTAFLVSKGLLEWAASLPWQQQSDSPNSNRHYTSILNILYE